MIIIMKQSKKFRVRLQARRAAPDKPIGGNGGAA